MSDWAKSKFHATRGKWINDLTDVVADDAEASRFTVRFNNASQCRLSVIGHRVGFIKDHELKLWYVATIWMSCNFSLCKLLDLVPHDLDASFVTSVQLKDSLSVKVGSKEIFRERQNSGGLTRAWWPVHEQMWHLPTLNRVSKGLNHFNLMGYIIDSSWSIFLNPRDITGLGSRGIEHCHIGWCRVCADCSGLIASFSQECVHSCRLCFTRKILLLIN